ncbi:MAG: low molecular weight protein arginine phosphatase [Elusimicrobiota bacterium]
MQPIRLLFVCTGNTCRSPMSAAILNHILPPEKKGRFKILSAGISATKDQPVSLLAIEVLKEINIEMSEHKAIPMDVATVEDADLIIAMTITQKRHLINSFPKARNKIFTLSEYASGPGSLHKEDIEDPLGGNLEVYRTARDQIMSNLKMIAKRIT